MVGDRVFGIGSGTNAEYVCVGEVVKHRRTLVAPDTAACHLCGRTHFESRGVYRHSGVDVCHDCLDLSMGLLCRDPARRR